MKGNCLRRQSFETTKSCAPNHIGKTQALAFSGMRLINGEEWKDIKFVDEEAKSNAVLIVCKTEPEPFEGFYVRRWDHPYEPNFETKTYNLLEFCQQNKIQKYLRAGKAGNLIVWTRDEKTKKLYFIGDYVGIQKFRSIEGCKDGAWMPRVALMATETFIVPHHRAIPMKDFEHEFLNRGLCFPTQDEICPFHSTYGHYVVRKELARVIMNVIEKNGVASEVYADLSESHTREMLKKQAELMKLSETRNRKINFDRCRRRFVTRQEMEHAMKTGIL